MCRRERKWEKEQPVGSSVPGHTGKVVEVANNKLIRNGSKIAMDEWPDGQGPGKKKPITEQWAVSPIHYVGTDKLPAVRAGAALNKSKLTTPPWPYLKYSFPTSPSLASIKLHLLRIPAPPLPTFQGLCKHWICYFPWLFLKICTPCWIKWWQWQSEGYKFGPKSLLNHVTCKVGKITEKKSPPTKKAKDVLPFRCWAAKRQIVFLIL